MADTDWDPTQFFRAGHRPANPFAILVLNQPINESALAVLRRHACFTICADGGANRFYDLMKKGGKEAVHLPSTVVGDLDSIKPSIKEHYQRYNVPVIYNSDQESTDFTKCIEYLRENTANILSTLNNSSSSDATTAQRQHHALTDRLDILIFGGLGGRVDQAFSQIHHLYTATQQPPASKAPNSPREEGDLYLVSEESISFVLRQGRNKIRTTTNLDNGAPEVNADCRYLEENIGILPVGLPAVISTEGLEWDVRDWKTEIGGRVSTSNHIRAEVIVVETSVPVLFTAELARRFKIGGGGEGGKV